jgi:hypothetical protein|tara:strand:- start:204 stop:623 length:420 start_codon:yes stop_codon:yes gene_type:complete
MGIELIPSSTVGDEQYEKDIDRGLTETDRVFMGGMVTIGQLQLLGKAVAAELENTTQMGTWGVDKLPLDSLGFPMGGTPEQMFLWSVLRTALRLGLVEREASMVDDTYIKVREVDTTAGRKAKSSILQQLHEKGTHYAK